MNVDRFVMEVRKERVETPLPRVLDATIPGEDVLVVAHPFGNIVPVKSRGERVDGGLDVI